MRSSDTLPVWVCGGASVPVATRELGRCLGREGGEWLGAAILLRAAPRKMETCGSPILLKNAPQAPSLAFCASGEGSHHQHVPQSLAGLLL